MIIHAVRVVSYKSACGSLLWMQYDQFSEALAEAAIRQQEGIRDAYRTLSLVISNHAVETNQTWLKFLDENVGAVQ